jgi:hypothetical protein
LFASASGSNSNLTPPSHGFANFCSGFGPRRSRQASLIDRLGVALDLGQTDMTADGGDLVHGAAGLGETSAGRLAQAV